MEPHIRLLDCTLRDGGHINQGKFGEAVIRKVIERLVEAEIDIIEVGFLWEKACDMDTARYFSIEDVKRILPKNKKNTMFSLMADFIDLEHLEPYDGTIDIIRLSFKRHRLEWALKTAQILMNKGYKVFVNPVNNNVYTDKEYLEVLEKVNKLHPYGFSIVDTFGVMRTRDLSHRYFLVENNLYKDITIGVHLHENLGLAYSLAQHFSQIASPTRKIVIDGSLLGMGRVPGNLCIEQIMEYMNEQYGRKYSTEPVYDAIDDYIAPIKSHKDTSWGYAIPYALSAKNKLHRTYAEYLMEKRRLRTKDIQRILKKISQKESEMFNEKYIEQLYQDYMNVDYDDKRDVLRLKSKLCAYKKIFIIAPGYSIIKEKEAIGKIARDRNTGVISVNFIPEKIGVIPQYGFFTNKKKIDINESEINTYELIFSSNLIEEKNSANYIINYNSITHFMDEYCDDSTLMLLNIIKKINIKSVMIAGFDGCKDGKKQFYDSRYIQEEGKLSRNEVVKRILRAAFNEMDIEFVTKSEYEW